LVAWSTLYSTEVVLRPIRRIADRLVCNAGELVDAIRFAHKYPTDQCGGVMVGASAHNMA
jgi:hypothetical protein